MSFSSKFVSVVLDFLVAKGTTMSAKTATMAAMQIFKISCKMISIKD